MTPDGTCAPELEPLRDLLEQQLSSGEELGAAICVDVDGETVADLWGGWADADRSRPWQADTIVNVWSVTKTVTSLAALMCVDRGCSTCTRRSPTTGRSSPPPARRRSRSGT